MSAGPSMPKRVAPISMSKRVGIISGMCAIVCCPRVAGVRISEWPSVASLLSAKLLSATFDEYEFRAAPIYSGKQITDGKDLPTEGWKVVEMVHIHNAMDKPWLNRQTPEKNIPILTHSAVALRALSEKRGEGVFLFEKNSRGKVLTEILDVAAELGPRNGWWLDEKREIREFDVSIAPSLTAVWKAADDEYTLVTLASNKHCMSGNCHGLADAAFRGSYTPSGVGADAWDRQYTRGGCPPQFTCCTLTNKKHLYSQTGRRPRACVAPTRRAQWGGDAADACAAARDGHGGEWATTSWTGAKGHVEGDCLGFDVPLFELSDGFRWSPSPPLWQGSKLVAWDWRLAAEVQVGGW